MKSIYEFTCDSIPKDKNITQNEKLYTEGFDLEQIWPQIEKLSNAIKSASETKFPYIKDISNIFIDDIENVIDNTLSKEEPQLITHKKQLNVN